MASSVPTGSSLSEIKDITESELNRSSGENLQESVNSSAPISASSPTSPSSVSSAPLSKTESSDFEDPKKKTKKKDKTSIRRGSWSSPAESTKKTKPGKSMLSSTLRASPSGNTVPPHRPSSWDDFNPDAEVPVASGRALELKVHYGEGLDSVMISRKFPVETTVAEVTKTFMGYYTLTGNDWRIHLEKPKGEEKPKEESKKEEEKDLRKSTESSGSPSSSPPSSLIDSTAQAVNALDLKASEDKEKSEEKSQDSKSETSEKPEEKSENNFLKNSTSDERKPEDGEKPKEQVKTEKPEWMHIDKRLSEYESQIPNSFLIMKLRPFEPLAPTTGGEKEKKNDPVYNTPISRTLSNFFLKGQSNGTPRRKSKATPAPKVAQKKPPLPWVFLQDLNSKLTVKKESDEEYTLEFEYSPDANMLPPWMNADKDGEVLKRGQFIKSHWNTRYLAMQGNQLFYFKSQPQKETEEPRGRFLVDEESYVEPLIDAEKESKTPRYGFVVEKILHEVTPTKKGEIVVVDDKYYVSTTLALCARSKEDMDTWIATIKKGIELKDKSTTSKVKIDSVTVTFAPSTGYIGLSPEWKHLLSSSAITERNLYDSPEENINLLRANFNKRDISEPIINHTPSSKARDNSATIADVVNKEDNPQTLYENFQLVGSGTFGEVFLAVNSRSQKTVAVKKMLLTPKREPLFINEISVQKVTEHPNVVRLFEAYKVNDYIWVALEFMSNGNLYQILTDFEATKHHFSEGQIAYIIAETLKALSYIHGMHRIHRDIKSDNILIGGEAEIKLADFGYAVQLADEDEKRSTICGSPYWMAPEVILGEKYGKEVDIWSLGIMLMELCDLQPPYILEAPARALVLIPSRPVPPLKTIDRWSKELKHFLSLCLQKDASLRPQAIELLQHPFLHAMCGAQEFKDQVLTKRKKAAKPCLIQ